MTWFDLARTGEEKRSAADGGRYTRGLEFAQGHGDLGG